MPTNYKPVTVNGLIEMDFAEVRALGKTLAQIAQENPKELRQALGMQVRNTQKTMAATVRNYAIRHKVGGKTVTLRRFQPRHPITVSLHGKAKGGKLAAVKSVSVAAIDGGFEVGWKGGLREFASRFQDGGKVGLYRDSAANHIRTRLFRAQWEAALREPEFQWRVYRALGHLFGIHTPEELEEASSSGDERAGCAHAVLRSMVFKKLREGGESLLENPRKWKGRPFVGDLAGDLRERFAPSVAAILEKKLKGRLPA